MMSQSSTDAENLPALTPIILEHARQAYEALPQPRGQLRDFLIRLADPRSSAAAPISIDTTHPISHYFVSSSHNSYLTGNQLWGKASADAYKDLLKRACRCIEIDVWDGDTPSSSEAEDSDAQDDQQHNFFRGFVSQQIGRLRARSNPKQIERVQTDPPADADVLMPTPWRVQSNGGEPRVLHGHTATKGISFRRVCQTVREYAFRSSDLPLVVSLEVHCGPAQQEIMVEIMNDYWKEYLVRPLTALSDSTSLPSLESLRRKILIKVKYVPPEKKDKEEIRSMSTAASADTCSSEEETTTKSQKKSKITEALSQMAVYTRAYHFKSFDQPEAKLPTHIFALSELKFWDLYREQRARLFAHNTEHLLRAYPKASRMLSSNLDPAAFWRTGVQFVALNWQKLNAAMMLNEAQFEGTGGWVLKPNGYYPSATRPTEVPRIALDLQVKILAGQNLGADDDIPNVYVKCELHTETQQELENRNRMPKEGKSEGGAFKFRTKTRHARDPSFTDQIMIVDKAPDLVPELTWLRFKVMDELSYAKDRLLGWACYRLDRAPQGLCLLRLRGLDAKTTNSMLLVDVRARPKT